LLKRNSLISTELADAYTSANYVVQAAQHCFTLEIGTLSIDLSNLYAEEGVNTACFITACNPFSVLMSTPINVARQAALLSEIDMLKLKSLTGHGESIGTAWRELSFLVLGITYEQSMELAIKHQQNAFIWCNETATPKLVLTR
jgi:hypothetical protein